ncbi:MAG TPA: phosphoribosylamine--glycine ligase, partial [Candidatus Kapabacteria bacterium]|nr:phosphoribosylamine--glycine ligase [Candidatus Kapabacteria bacterium]
EKNIGLTVVGPEVPLVAGVVDAFEEQGLTALGPKKFAAQLEGSKSFAKEFMRKYNVPTAQYRMFTRDQVVTAKEYVAGSTLPLVIKADGLAAGKGVLICNNVNEALNGVAEMFEENVFGGAGDSIVIEEFMRGEEASVFALCDGERYVTFAPAQDHKRIGDDDTGKNTGGMGAFAPAKIVDEKSLTFVKKEIIERVLNGMKQEGCPYTGFLYCGLMMTEAGPKVVEFNCRLGDPETQVVLPLIDDDFVKLCLAAAEKKLLSNNVNQKNATAVCVVMASGGYPDTYPTGKQIHGLEKFSSSKDAVAFHAGTKKVDGKIVTSGGRVLGVTAIGRGKDLKETIALAYAAVGKISFEGEYHRTDIGAKGLRYDR